MHTPLTLFQKLEVFATERPGQVALSWANTNLTYAQLSQAVLEARRVLVASSPLGEYVHLVSLRHGGLVAFLLAGLSLGRTVAILDPRSKVDRLLSCAEGSPSSVWVIDKSLSVINKGIEARSTAPIIVTSSTPLLSQVGNLADAYRTGVQGKLVIFTSGSTGNPKGVLIDQTELEQRIHTERNWFGVLPEVPVLGALPLNFDVGLTQLFTSLWVGAEHHFLDSWLPNDILSAIEKLRPQGLALSPMVWRLLLEAQKKDQFWPTLNCLNYMTLSGGDLAPDLLQTIATHLTRTRFFKTYGQSEFFRIASFLVNKHPEKLTTVGHAYPGVTIEVRDSDGSLCPPNKIGEIFSNGNGRMSGYLLRGQYLPVKNEFHATGDLGFLDEDGFLTIRGRKDEMIKILDQRIFPKDIANSIDDILGIQGTEVVAIKTEQEYQLVAFICPPLANASEQQTLLELKKTLTNYMTPRQVIFLKQWPTTASGKLDKQYLISLVTLPQT